MDTTDTDVSLPAADGIVTGAVAELPPLEPEDDPVVVAMVWSVLLAATVCEDPPPVVLVGAPVSAISIREEVGATRSVLSVSVQAGPVAAMLRAARRCLRFAVMVCTRDIY